MERYCEHKMKPCNGRKVVFGLIILLIGVIFLFDNLDLLPYEVKDIVFTWQMLLIAIGLISLSGRNCFPGIIMILVGAFFLAPHLFSFPFNFTKLFWPILLIAIGLIMIFRRNIAPHNKFPQPPRPPHPPFTQMDDNMDNLIDEVNVFGGSKRNVVSQSFSGGKITAIFGGTDLDFTRAKLAEGCSVLDLVCIFGGASIILPADWNVRTEVVSILGGFSDKRQNIPSTVDKEKVLVIKGVAIFGGGEIKSFREL